MYLKLPLFASLIISLFLIVGNSNIAWAQRAATPEERAAIREETQRDIDCMHIDLNQPMTMEDYISKCVNGIISDDGCRLNIEKACVNGESANLASGIKTFADDGIFNTGFDTRFSNGLRKNDFSDSEQMYNDVRLPNRTSTKLCTKIDAVENIQNLKEQSLPCGNYTIESNPPAINPDKNIGGISLHWKINVSSNCRKTFVVQLRGLGNVYGPFQIRGKTEPYEATSSHNLDDATTKLIIDNLVMCKKAETVLNGKPTPFVEGDPSTLSPEDIRKAVAVHEYFMKANPGLDPSLTAEFSSLFKINNVFADSSSEQRPVVRGGNRPASNEYKAATSVPQSPPAAAMSQAGTGVMPKDPSRNYAGTPCEPFTRPASADGSSMYGHDSVVVYGKRAYRCEAQDGRKVWTVLGPREKLGKDWRQYEAHGLEER